MTDIGQLLESESIFQTDLDAVKQVVNDNFTTGKDYIDRILRRFVDTPGKMLRPLVVILSARTGGGDTAAVHRLAAAVEILHIATLVHDDIVDQSPMRRGIPTIHVTDGVRKAVLVGDYLFTRFFRLAADLARPEHSRFLAGVVSRICESEIQQSRDLKTGMRDYLRGIAGKTAMLFVLSAYLGSAERDDDTAEAAILRYAAYGIGMSFQILDDVLDYAGHSDAWGKPARMDIRRGIATLPLILAGAEDQEEYRRLISRKTRRGTGRKLLRFVEKHHGMEAARSRAAYYTTGAVKALRRLPESEAREALIRLAGFLETRNQ